MRDVATAHLLVMTAPAAVGRRFLLSNGAAFPGKDIDISDIPGMAW